MTVFPNKIYVYLLTKKLKQLDDLHADTHTYISLTLFLSLLCMCVCACVFLAWNINSIVI